MKVDGTKYVDIIVEKVQTEIIHHTIQLWIIRDGQIKPYGTGLFCSIQGVYFIFSAGHVLKYLEENDSEHLFIKIGNEYTNVLGEIRFLLDKESKLDFGYIRLDKKMEGCLNEVYISLQVSQTSNFSPDLGVMSFGILGFSEVDFLDKGNPLSSFASFYLTDLANDSVYNYYGFDKEHFIITNMKGKGRDLNKGWDDSIIRMPSHFHGISGGGLWYFTVDLSGNLNYKLVGLMTEYRKGKHYCFIALKIGFVLGLINDIEKIEMQ